MDKKEIVVVIPIYNAILSHHEEMALAQCVKILVEYSLVIVKPANLDITAILARHSVLQTEDFPEHCFSSLRSYNKLVLDELFYQRFSLYQYMLIYQLDAYVFKDELLYWASKGYDYIGAPWLPLEFEGEIKRNKIRLIKRFFYRLLKRSKVRQWRYYEYEVGNGGFSLRRIEKMLEITRKYKEKIMFLLSDEHAFYPEDVLLFVEFRGRKCRLKTPDFREAMKFSLEVGAWWAYEYNNRQLPFGCHAWYHKDYYPFWSNIICV